MKDVCLSALLALVLIFAGGMTSAAEERIVIEIEGWNLVGDLRVPEAEAPVPAVLLLNKAAGNRQVYTAMAEELAARGIASLRLDLRAHGESNNLGTFGPPYDVPLRVRFPGTENDISRALEYLETTPAIDGDRIAVVGASYSGEFLGISARQRGYARAYVELSPGSFSEESIAAIDGSGADWIFYRTETELPFFDDLYDAIDAGSEVAEFRVLPGDAHATDILDLHPKLNTEIADWLAVRLGTALPDALVAGWQGERVCELLQEDAVSRMLHCAFPPGVGHERHYHPPHLGYILGGGTMQITDADGVRESSGPSGGSWRSEGVQWHEVLNIGDTTTRYLIIEKKR